ncbi:hypothetical protein DFJ74DRAFT_773338 [Hyaloraphidium curvatum]|nr:hypothetical protein DFJ74DRAFT_773338 [Hyaloraphidium curvatum]
MPEAAKSEALIVADPIVDRDPITAVLLRGRVVIFDTRNSTFVSLPAEALVPPHPPGSSEHYYYRATDLSHRAAGEAGLGSDWPILGYRRTAHVEVPEGRAPYKWVQYRVPVCAGKGSVCYAKGLEIAELAAEEKGNAGKPPECATGRPAFRACKYCLKTNYELGVEFRRCGRCRMAEYCGEECQRKDWRKEHREQCTPRSELKAELKKKWDF